MKTESSSYVILVMLTLVLGGALFLIHPALAPISILLVSLLYKSELSIKLLLVGLFFPILISDRILGELVGVSGATTLQKAAVLALMIGAALFSGATRVPKPVFVIWLVYGTLCVVSLLRLGSGDLSDESTVVNAAIGFAFPLLFFVVSPRRVSGDFMLKIVMWLPVLAVLVGVVLQVLGVSDLFRQEYTGARRLTGGLFSAYMAAYGMFGAFAAVLLWVRKAKLSLVLLCFNIMVVVLTGTRGPLIVVGLLVVAVILAGGSSSSRVSFSFRAFMSIVAVAAAVIAAPVLLERISGSGDAQGSLSGREVAWAFFWGFVEDSPWMGNGLGFSSVAASTSSSPIIREYFVAPHNTYLQLALDAGILGAAVLVAAYVWLCVECARGFHGVERALVVTFLLGIAFYAFFDNLLGAVQPTVLFGFTLAALYRIKSQGGVEIDIAEADLAKSRSQKLLKIVR